MPARVFDNLFPAVLLIFLTVCPAALADESTVAAGTIELHKCTDAKLEVELLCHPDWELQTEEDMVLMIVSQKPLVTVTIAKSQGKGISLRRLTPGVLQEMGQYAEGFETHNVLIDGQRAIEVKGHSLAHPTARFLDYYIVRRGQLYSVLFSVDPQERWPDYEPLLLEIKGSVHFL